MKKHLLSLLDPAYRRLSISLALAGVLLIIGSQLVGITDNLPGIVTGIIGAIICATRK